MQSKERDDVLLIFLDFSGDSDFFALFCQLSNLLLRETLRQNEI